MPKIQPKKEYTKVINFYELPEIKKNMTTVDNPGFDLTQIKLPCRMVVVALSGGGKTNFVMNFIKYTCVKQGTFSHIHVYHKIDEELYTHLSEKCGDRITFYKRLSDLPAAKDLKSNGHQLVIFDDCVADKNQEKISEYFLYGRKINNNLGCSCIYISQRYFGIPTTVRAQLNYMILLLNIFFITYLIFCFQFFVIFCFINILSEYLKFFPFPCFLQLICILLLLNL
jgi:hypothetical protein